MKQWSNVYNKFARAWSSISVPSIYGRKQIGLEVILASKLRPYILIYLLRSVSKQAY